MASPSNTIQLTQGIDRELRVPSHVARHLISSTSALGAGVMIERGMGFLANILAARLGGASTFGAYSLAFTTASNISTYAGGGIGATAARFSGKYPRGSAGYSTLARVLFIISLFSGVVAALGLWLGAPSIAHLLRKESFTAVLRWSAFSAAGIVFLECARGFFVGQRRLRALILLSLIVGTGMITLLPLAAARLSPTKMIVSQGAVSAGAVIVCLLLSRPLGLRASVSDPHAKAVAPVLREVWSFGMVQLAGLAGINIAGWWLVTLVARADSTLIQMSFFAVASQLRNIVGLAPGLLTESSYAVMADRDGEKAKTPGQVMAVCTYASTVATLLCASAGIILVPWVLTLLYGSTYSAAGVAAAIAFAIAVVHMGNASAAARLTIVSIRTTGMVNTVWAVFVVAAGTAVLLHGGNAWKAMAILLAGHLMSAALVLIALARRDCLPQGINKIFFVGAGTATSLAVMAFVRGQAPALALPLTAAMVALLAAACYALFMVGRRHCWLPDPESLRQLAAGAKGRLFGLCGRAL
jgi:O-antigen/teichoic acid export membrane protein